MGDCIDHYSRELCAVSPAPEVSNFDAEDAEDSAAGQHTSGQVQEIEGQRSSPSRDPGRDHEALSGAWKSDRRVSSVATTNAGDARILPDAFCVDRAAACSVDTLDT